MDKTEVQTEEAESSCKYAVLKTHEPGFATTMFLESLLREHLSVMRDSRGFYIGNPEYLTALDSIRKYNLTREEIQNE